LLALACTTLCGEAFLYVAAIAAYDHGGKQEVLVWVACMVILAAVMGVFIHRQYAEVRTALEGERQEELVELMWQMEEPGAPV